MLTVSNREREGKIMSGTLGTPLDMPAPMSTSMPTPMSSPASAPPVASAGRNLGGLVRMMTPDALNELDAQQAAERAQRRLEARQEPALEQLSLYIRQKFDMMRRHRDSADGWTDRMLAALRMFNGEYDPTKLAQIREFGGSEIYARIVAVKCRGATAMLRDIYMTVGARSWAIEPSPVPTIPDDAREAADSLLSAESAIAQQAASQGTTDPVSGAPVMAPTEEEIAARKTILEAALDDAARKKAREEAVEAGRYLDDRLVEGGFYEALVEFLADLTMFPFACLHGPVVYMVPDIKWERGPNGQAKLVKKNVARMFWRRISPFDVWWTPGAATVMGADFVVRERKARSELNAMIGVPGYRDDKIRAVLDEYTGGWTETTDSADTIRASQESRENPVMNESGMYDCLQFTGSVQGRLLRDFGMSAKDIPDETRDYAVQLWMIGQHVIKVQLSPSPRDRPPFYITSYNKVPGTLVGHAVPDILSDVQDVCNATLRALVNNMGMSSGPQVAINTDAIANGEDTTRIWPWRVWQFANRPGSNNADPVKFFQPTSNAQTFMAIYEKFTQIADEVSAIPRYVTGSERMGGAGRTASGLAMLMGNASKMLQTVASNIDQDVFAPLLQSLYDIVMLTDKTGRLRGDEQIAVKGVAVALQRETERQRQIEMLQATSNPLDAEIIGIRGRGALLRAIAGTMGLDGQVIIPSDEELANREAMAKAAAMAQQGAPPMAGPNGAGGDPVDTVLQAQGGQSGGENTGPRAIQGPRTNLQQRAPGA